MSIKEEISADITLLQLVNESSNLRASYHMFMTAKAVEDIRNSLLHILQLQETGTSEIERALQVIVRILERIPRLLPSTSQRPLTSSPYVPTVEAAVTAPSESPVVLMVESPPYSVDSPGSPYGLAQPGVEGSLVLSQPSHRPF